jgi:hypothetical protein
MTKSFSRRSLFRALGIAAAPAAAGLSANTITSGTVTATGPVQAPLGGTPLKLESGGTYVIEGLPHLREGEHAQLREFARLSGVKFMVLPPGAKLTTYVQRTWNGRIKQLRVSPEVLMELMTLKFFQEKPLLAVPIPDGIIKGPCPLPDDFRSSWEQAYKRGGNPEAVAIVPSGHKWRRLTTHGFPSDLRIVHAEMDHSTDQIIFVCESESFDPLDAPAMTWELPLFQATYKSGCLSLDDYRAQFSQTQYREPLAG